MDFNLLSDIVLILIAPFDLIGEGRYRYTFQMCCLENRETILADGAVRKIFLWNVFKGVPMCTPFPVTEILLVFP